MKVKGQVNFKDLRDKGANALDISGEEVIQMKTKGKMLCIVEQDFLLELIKFKQEHFSLDSLFSNLLASANSHDFLGGAKSFHNPQIKNLNFGSLNSNNMINSRVESKPNLEERVGQLEETIKMLLSKKEDK